MSQIIASVYTGDPAPLKGLVESEAVYEYVRDAALEAFVVLVHAGLMPHGEVVGYFRSLFREKLSRERSYVWSALARAVTALPAPELAGEVRQAYADNLTDPDFADLEDFEHGLRVAQAGAGEKFDLLTDAIGEMEWWAAFDPDATDDLDEPDDPWPTVDPEPLPAWPHYEPLPPTEPSTHVPPEPVLPVRRGHPKIGRNDPCPCGSGKKYKKCCGK